MNNISSSAVITTWQKEITEALAEHGESWDDVVASTLSSKELNAKFDSGFGGTKGAPFTVWTNHFIYFPAIYDGQQWVSCVPRNPCGIKTHHVGGGE